MSMTAMLMVWGIITAAFLGLVMYRSLIGMREDDQLFLDPAESQMEEEQRQLRRRLDRIAPYTKGLGYASAGILALIAGVWVYRGIAGFNAMPR